MSVILTAYTRMIFYYFNKRLPWMVLLTTALLPILLALLFQHSMNVLPCVYCIYQRVALSGIVLCALLVLCAPTCRFLRGLGILLWLYSGVEGLSVAWEQTQRYLHPLRFYGCDFKVRFPTWLPLDKWFPGVFQADAACSAVNWSWFGLNLPQWMVVLFASQVLVSFVVLASQYHGWRRPVGE